MIHLITGGSGSGKSAFAEAAIVSLGEAQRFYIATMYPFDEESFRRIERHRNMRKEKKFTTVECYMDLKKLQLPSGCNILLECMSNLVANEMYREDGAGEETAAAVWSGVRHLAKTASNLVIVTNEIFSDGIDYDPETIRYQNYLGEINRKIASLADQVTEVVYGIPVRVKGEQL